MFQAVNDNLTTAEFEAGVAPHSTKALESQMASGIIEFRKPESWMMLHVRPVALQVSPTQMILRQQGLQIAAQPHPQCPEWDGKTPRMSGVPSAPSPRQRRTHLRPVS